MLTVSACCRYVAVGMLALVAASGFGQELSRITVHADRPGPKISPTFYGLMTEEINHSYDGGLYAELVRNRSFRDAQDVPVHWSTMNGEGGSGDISIDRSSSDQAPSLKLTVEKGPAGIANEGYWGIPVWPSTTYRASFIAKASDGFHGPLTVAIESKDGKTIFAQGKVGGLTTDWRKFALNLRTGKVAPTADAVFVIASPTPATIWFRTVSLFPPTYHKRANGNRIDLMEKLGEMKPSFLRLPGGNYLEGNTIAERFDWKATIGDTADRKGHQGPWGYRSSDGMGLLEFLGWCEDLHMQPVLAVFAGYALGGEHVEAGPKLEPFVQDALDEIEYTVGDTSTTWGARRALDGHPRPFPLTYVEIGNEDAFDRSGSYDGRYAQFYNAIKAKYPRLQIIATMPVHSVKPDVVDDHYYRSAAEMARDSGHYDTYARTGPKIFVGEWASTEGSPTPTHQAALGDASWLIGLERNSDLVVMESYAPLLVNVNRGAAQWGTNLVGYNALSSFGSPSFYVQSLFARNTGDTVLPTEVKIAAKGPDKPFVPHGGIGLGTWRTESEFKDIEVTHNGESLYRKDFASGTSDWRLGRGTWRVEDGSLRQSSMADDTHATGGNPDWTDYTYHVKARKISGEEGFLIVFHAEDRRNYWQWNVGGWGNSRSAIQRHEGSNADEVGESTETKVETGRWYDIKIDVHGTDVKCYLDDKLITEITETPHAAVAPLYVGSSRVDATGEIIVKVVNVSPNAMPAEISVDGVSELAAHASGWELAGQPDDVNSIAEPKKVFPKKLDLDTAGKSFTRTYPPFSVTVLRLKAKR